MQKKDCFFFGTVFKLQGYKGDVNIYNDNDISLDFTALDYFLIDQKNELIPYFIVKARETKSNTILVSFEDIISEKEALKILQKKVYLPKEILPKIDENTRTEKKLIGLSVIDISLGSLGKVSFINSQSAQKLIYVTNDEKVFCFPMHDKFVKKIDFSKDEIIVDIPEDIIELN